MQAMLLAAGFGTRLRPYTLLRPKPLFPVLNRPLLHILLDMLLAAGCRRIVVNCHYLADQIRKAATSWPVILQEEQTILGTGGSLRQALDSFESGPILVMNGDICHNIDLHALYVAHAGQDAGVTMAVHRHPRFNTLRIRHGRIVGFGSRPQADGWAYTGVQVVDPEIIRLIPPGEYFHIIDLYRHLATEGRIAAWPVADCFWHDIGTPDDYRELHRELLQAPRFSWQPVVTGPEQWCIHARAQISPESRLTGWGVVGAGARLVGNVRLHDCVVWDGALLQGQSHRSAIIAGNG